MSIEPDASTANPTAGAVIACRDDLVELLRARKNELGLSNAWIENALHLGENDLTKTLGPTQSKGLSLLLAIDLAELFGARLVLQIDPELEAKMRLRWEVRDEKNVHPSRRVSQVILERARPVFFQQLSRLGNEARKAKLPPEARASIARAAALARWRLHRAAVKSQTVGGSA
jgi:hypothetical protein